MLHTHFLSALKPLGVMLLLAPAFFGTTSMAHAQDGKALIDVLVRKGILTSGEAEQIIKEAADRQYAPPAVAPNARHTTRLTLGGRLQVQYDGLATAIEGAANPAAARHFFIRRAYLTLKASLGETTLIDVNYDMASSSFDSAIFRWRQSRSLVFDVGLRKVNLAYEESMISSGALKAIERTGATRYFVEPQNARRLGAGGYRIGVYAEGSSGPFFWGTAVTNPERVTNATSAGTSANNEVAYWGNIGIKGTSGPASGSMGAGLGFLPDQGGQASGAGSDLWVGNLYFDVTAGPWTLLAEYLYSSNQAGAAGGLATNSQGWWFQPSYRFDRQWEAVARISHVDTDGRGINLSDGIRSAPPGGTMDKLNDYYLGFTYYLSGNNDCKLQAGYVYGKSWDSIGGGPARARTQGLRSQMQVQF